MYMKCAKTSQATPTTISGSGLKRTYQALINFFILNIITLIKQYNKFKLYLKYSI